MAAWAPPPDHPPPPHIRQFFLTKKIKFIKGPQIGGQFYVHGSFFGPLSLGPTGAVFEGARAGAAGRNEWGTSSERKHGNRTAKSRRHRVPVTPRNTPRHRGLHTARHNAYMIKLQTT